MTATLDFFPLPSYGWSWGSPYGPRGSGFHGGVDLPAPEGLPIIATKNGLLNQGWDAGGGGNWSMLWDDDGWVHGYGHAVAYYDPDGSGPATSLNGYRVVAGQTIAYVGTTGGSTGNHLHYARKRVGAVAWGNPTAALQEAASAGRFIDLYQTPPVEDIMALSAEEAEEIVTRVVTREFVNKDMRDRAYLDAQFAKVMEQLDPRWQPGFDVLPMRDLVEQIHTATGAHA